MNPAFIALLGASILKGANEKSKNKYGYFQHPSGQLFEYQLNTPDYGQALGQSMLETAGSVGGAYLAGQGAGFGQSPLMGQNTPSGIIDPSSYNYLDSEAITGRMSQYDNNPIMKEILKRTNQGFNTSEYNNLRI